MRLEDSAPEVVLHARHAANRIKDELEYTFSRVIGNVESSVRTASGEAVQGMERFKAQLMQLKAERSPEDVFRAIPLAKISVRPDKAPGASTTVPENRSVSDVECTLASVRDTSIPPDRPPIPVKFIE